MLHTLHDLVLMLMDPGEQEDAFPFTIPIKSPVNEHLGPPTPRSKLIECQTGHWNLVSVIFLIGLPYADRNIIVK